MLLWYVFIGNFWNKYKSHEKSSGRTKFSNFNPVLSEAYNRYKNKYFLLLKISKNSTNLAAAWAALLWLTQILPTSSHLPLKMRASSLMGAGYPGVDTWPHVTLCPTHAWVNIPQLVVQPCVRNEMEGEEQNRGWRKKELNLQLVIAPNNVLLIEIKWSTN